MLAIGITVSAEPAPKPAAVSPAASPRRSGNHFSALPTEAAVDDAGADAADRRADIEQEQRVGDRVDHPGDRDQHAAAADHDLRAELVDQVTLDRHQPGFGQHEDGEGHLDRGAAPVVFLIDRIDEQRPAVLQVGDHHHADDAEDQLTPARRFRRHRWTLAAETVVIFCSPSQ